MHLDITPYELDMFGNKRTMSRKNEIHMYSKIHSETPSGKDVQIVLKLFKANMNSSIVWLLLNHDTLLYLLKGHECKEASCEVALNLV